MASLEKRSVSDLIEVMADERWARLAGQQGIAYAKTVADAMNRKLDMDNAAGREKLRRAVLDLVAGRKIPGKKTLPSVVDIVCYEIAMGLRHFGCGPAASAETSAWQVTIPRIMLISDET